MNLKYLLQYLVWIGKNECKYPLLFVYLHDLINIVLFLYQYQRHKEWLHAILSLLRNSRGVNATISGLSGVAFSAARTGTTVLMNPKTEITGK